MTLTAINEREIENVILGVLDILNDASVELGKGRCLGLINQARAKLGSLLDMSDALDIKAEIRTED